MSCRFAIGQYIFIVRVVLNSHGYIVATVEIACNTQEHVDNMVMSAGFSPLFTLCGVFHRCLNNQVAMTTINQVLHHHGLMIHI